MEKIKCKCGKDWKIQDNLSAYEGEVVGPGIQKNRLGLSEIEFHVFRVYDQNEKRYLLYDERKDFCDEYGLPHVEMADRGGVFNYDLDTLLHFAEGKYKSGKEREGVVFEADIARDTEFGGHLSFKVISNAYLLGGGN